MASLIQQLLIRIFVDSLWPYRYWHCHCLPERSFIVSGRQLHVCARCTGIVIGFAFIPFCLILGYATVPLAISAIAIFLLDAMSQLFGWRQSYNALRLITGILTGAFLPAAILNLLWRIFINA